MVFKLLHLLPQQYSDVLSQPFSRSFCGTVAFPKLHQTCEGVRPNMETVSGVEPE